VQSFAIEDIEGTATRVTDVYGNFMLSTTVPGSGNISTTSGSSKDIEIDNIPNIPAGVSNITAVTGGAVDELDALDSFVLNFADTVGNDTDLVTAITGNAVYGASGSSGTAVWDTDKTSLTVTLGTGETFSSGDTIQFTGVEDDAGNVTDTIMFTVTIA